MVQRPVPVANGQRVLDRAVHVGLRAGHRIENGFAEREIGGDGGCERAAGSMRVRRVDAARV